MREIPFDPKCHARHLGLYAIEPGYLTAAVASIKAGTWPLRAEHGEDDGRGLYAVTGEGIAVIPMAGPILKGASKFPHVNSLRVRRAVRAAVRDDRVKAIVLHVDSPGGSVAGTQELADDVHAAAQIKPLVGHIDDLGASAAYWVLSQVETLSINRAGMVGSIGVLAVVHDSSKMAEMEGVEVHVVSTGKHKGAFIPGAPIEDHHLEELQSEVDGLFSLFLGAIERGRGARGMQGEKLRGLADGRMFGAADALRYGLVDRVASLDEVIGDLAKKFASDDSERTARRRARRAKLRRFT